MKLHVHSGKKNKSITFSEVVVVLYTILMIFFTLLSVLPVNLVKGTSYVPTAPTGSALGFVNIDYDYVIVTMNRDSSWMFDWDDGTTTTWLKLADGQTSITQSHHWDTAGTYQVRTKFKSSMLPDAVSSNPLTVTISTYTNDDLPSVPVLFSGKIQGIVESEYTYSTSANDPHGFKVCYRFDWGDGILSEWTSLVPSGTSSIATYMWQKSGEYSVKIQAKNQYGLESLWSDLIQVTIHNASEDDGVSIDLIVLNGVSHHIVYSSVHTGTFYNTSSGTSSLIQWNGGGEYLLDDDSDGRWEYLYTPATGSIVPIADQVVLQKNIFSGLPWLLIFIIIGIISIIITTILVLIKTGYIYMYEEVVVEK